MKVSKAILKSLIKECLVEILVEGIDSSSGTTLQEAARRRPTQSKQTRQTASQNGNQQRQKNPRVNEVVKMAAGGDPILESLMADTASTTYQTQAENEIPSRESITAGASEGPSGPQYKENDKTDSPWANLAFNSSTPSLGDLAALGFNPTK